MQAPVETDQPISTTTNTRTSADWAQLITGLNTLAQNYAHEITALEHDRDLLALDAALGDAQVAKRQGQLTADINKKQGAAQSTRAAIAQAEVKKRQAEQAEQAEVEQERQNKLKTLTTQVLAHADQFDAHMEQLVIQGTELRETIKEMLKLATPVEARSWAKFLMPNPYMRAAEHAGLRSLIEFQVYPGPKEHVTPLATDIAATLERWLPVVITLVGAETAQAETAEPEPEDKQDRTGGPGWPERLRERVKFHTKKEKQEKHVSNAE